MLSLSIFVKKNVKYTKNVKFFGLRGGGLLCVDLPNILKNVYFFITVVIRSFMAVYSSILIITFHPLRKKFRIILQFKLIVCNIFIDVQFFMSSYYKLGIFSTNLCNLVNTYTCKDFGNQNYRKYIS